MSAGRNASTVLASLLATIVLFAIFVGVSKLPVLEKHAYVSDTGWQWPPETQPPSADNWDYYDSCQDRNVKSGFPLANTRGAASAVRCLRATNPLMRSMNYALYFAVSAILSVAVVTVLRERLSV